MTAEMKQKLIDDITQQMLKPLIRSIYSAKSDVQKEKDNQHLFDLFQQLLNVPESFDYGFDSLRKDIGLLYSPDDKFRIVHWNLPKEDGTHEFYGFIQENFSDKKHGNVFQLYPLTDKSSEIKNADNVITDNKKWYGTLYNRIIVKKVKSKTYYTLIGWKGNDKFTQKKIIDVLTFDQTGIPHFGADIFNYGKRFPKRVIFEYSATCSNMPVRYSPKKDTIIFGHLAPVEPQLAGQLQYYCCDMSYDGFGWKKGKWSYGEDVQALNDKDQMDNLYHDPHDRREGHEQSHEYKDPNHKKRQKKK
jgi:hypothetical protein